MMDYFLLTITWRALSCLAWTIPGRLEEKGIDILTMPLRRFARGRIPHAVSIVLSHKYEVRPCTSYGQSMYCT